MTDVSSSLIHWNEKEILPRGIFLTSSGSGGDRLLFWQSSLASNPSKVYDVKKDQSTNDNRCSSNIGASFSQETELSKDHTASVSSLTTLLTTPSPKIKNTANINNRGPVSTSENPFALSLISDRTMSCNESTLGNSPISSGLNPNFIGSSVDRTLNNCPTICSNITPSLCNTSTMSSNNPVGNVTTNLSTSNIVLGGIYSTDSSLQVPSSESPLIIGNLGISNIEGIPANVLLSLLHQQTQALQRKIYIKLENSIFVGAAFNLSPSDTEGIGLSEDTDDSNTKSSDGESLRTTTGGAHTMISFTVGFLMDSSAPPSVLSYLTELSRLIGSQIRRAELMFNYLRDQRDIITSTLEKYSYVDANSWPSSSTTDHNMNKYGSDNINTNRLNQSFPSKRHVKLSEVINTERENSLSSQLTDHDYNENVNQSTNENIPVNKTNDMHDYNNDTRNETTTMNPLERLVQISSLCAELKSILDSICKTGHVNVKINKIYPVCFCLPHKAYCLNNSDKISKFMIAVRPMAVWRAMDKIRPYHALILLLRKDVLLKDFLPTDINPTLNDFINELSPTVSLCNIAERIHSQTHCLNLALWLIYRGHALIVYPIVANNMYVLAPHSKAWFTPQLIGQFATSFPEVNLAELLTSFSTTFMLKDHFHPSIGIADNLHYDADSENNANCFRNKPSKTSWTNLPLTQKINLIAWLLRRRLIIQIHIYIFPTFLSSVNQMNPLLNVRNIPNNLENLHISCNVINTTYSSCNSSSSNSSEYDSDEITPEYKDNENGKNPYVDSTIPDLDELCKMIPKDVLHELTDNLPVESRQSLLHSILSHPGAVQNIQLLKLFSRILPHLPAHIEEIMFREQVRRSTLIECIERFSPFLATARLPDPVTACFAGIPWPN